MTSQQECIFCKIVNGDIPCYKVYEDEAVLAFLDINPANLGHTLIIPKRHYQDIYDLPEDVFMRIGSVAKKLSLDYRDKKGISALNLISSNGGAAQQDVFHFHLHLLPRDNEDGIKFYWRNKKEELIDSFPSFIEGL